MLVYRVADRDHERLVSELGLIGQFDSSRPVYTPAARPSWFARFAPRATRLPAAAVN